MKNLIWVVIAALVLGGGYTLYSNNVAEKASMAQAEADKAAAAATAAEEAAAAKATEEAAAAAAKLEEEAKMAEEAAAAAAAKLEEEAKMAEEAAAAAAAKLEEEAKMAEEAAAAISWSDDEGPLILPSPKSNSRSPSNNKRTHTESLHLFDDDVGLDSESPAKLRKFTAASVAGRRR